MSVHVVCLTLHPAFYGLDAGRPSMVFVAYLMCSKQVFAVGVSGQTLITKHTVRRAATPASRVSTTESTRLTQHTSPRHWPVRMRLCGRT